MGFRTGSYAKIWSIEDMGKFHKVNLSTSRKDKQTGEYITDFSSTVSFLSKAHTDAAKLKEGDRIKIGDCEATTVYNKEKEKKYYNYTVYSFELADQPAKEQPKKSEPAQEDGADDPF